MPTVRMKTESAGPAGNRSAGKIYTVTAEEGEELVAGRFAEWVEPPRKKAVETAVRPKPPNAALRTDPPSKAGE